MTKQVSKEKSSSKGVTLKRTVTIKAVVTEKFKEYMLFELESGIRRSESRLGEIDLRVSDIKKEGAEGSKLLAQQLNAEKIQLRTNVAEFKSRKETINKLELGSSFVQGTVDGFVAVVEGDNIYEKLGGMEIVAKDGIVEKIVHVADLGIKK
jgi:hypothetical protein